MSITRQDIGRLSDYLCRRYHARVVSKDQAIEMKIIGSMFDVLRIAIPNIPGSEEFKSYATTLGPIVYLPDGLTDEQRLYALVHEVQHVHQFWTGGQQTGLGGGFTFAWLYLTEPEARIRYEVEAYRTGLELQWFLERSLPDLNDIVFPLERGYALSPAQAQFARDMLEAAATTVAAGGVSTELGRASCDWIRDNAPGMIKRA